MTIKKQNGIAVDYLAELFEPSDRLAVVLVNKSESAVIQRLGEAASIAAPDFQDWLWEKNLHGYEVYVSMNPLHPWATGRTKSDVASIRHLYLDFDEDGTSAVERLMKRRDLPRPNHRLSSSPGRWQVVWRVDGFSIKEAEALQRALAWEMGADPAATDCARVFRLPGYYNHKHGQPHWVSVDHLSNGTATPASFPKLPQPSPSVKVNRTDAHRSPAGLSQSERDWAFAKRALARGDSPETVAAAIARYRRYEKHDPQYYAELTVRKAAGALVFENVREEPPGRI